MRNIAQLCPNRQTETSPLDNDHTTHRLRMEVTLKLSVLFDDGNLAEHDGRMEVAPIVESPNLIDREGERARI